MRFIVLTLFKEMFDAFVNTSIIKRAIERNIVSIDVLDIREFTKDKHKRVDFPPYGGGSGMIMSAQPLGDAIDYAIFSLEKYKKKIKIIYMSPRGKLLNYNISKKLSQNDCNYIIICGHYEGIDERIIDEYNVEEISIGDYVLTGGELACQVLMDSVIRLIPGVISQESLSEESHTNGLLEYPQYTKPYEFKGRKVPDILLSGHHKMIADYRRQESIRITRQHRPDLINNEIIPKKGGKLVMDIINAIENEYKKEEVVPFKVGDTVDVHIKIKEGNKERIQVFTGTVIKRQNSGLNETFTVRKISYGVGVEKTFPTHSPRIAKIEVKRVGKVRRAKLYYLRDRVGKAAKTREKIEQ